MRGIEKLTIVALLMMLLLGVVAPMHGYAQGPIEQVPTRPLLEGLPVSSPTDLHPEILADEVLRDGILRSNLTETGLGHLAEPLPSAGDDGTTYTFASGTAVLEVNKPRGAIYNPGEDLEIRITSLVPGYFVLFDWPIGRRWQWFDLGYVPADEVVSWYGTVADRPGFEMLIAINLLNWDYGWTWFWVVS